MAFVVSAGRLESISQPVLPAYPAVSSLQLSEQLFVDYAELYRAQPNVRTVVSFLGRNIAQLGLHVFRRLSDTDRERLHDHPLSELLARPAPPEMKLTRYRLIERLVSDLAIYDNAYWAKVRAAASGPVGYLVPIPPHRVTPLGESWLSVAGWRVHGNRGDIDLPAEEVVHFRGYNPDDARMGLSPMETLRELLAEEWEAGRSRQQMWRNGARTSGVIERPADAPAWSPQAKATFKADWHAQFTGDGPQAGGTPVLEDGMTYKSAGLDPKAAQYIEARKLTREEVASAFHIPLPMVGILDNATYSNITEQHKMLYQDTLGPWLTMIAEEVALQLLPDVDDTTGVYVEFNIGEKLRGSFEEQAAAMSTSTGRPWMTANEARARFNLPERDDGDGLVVPLNVAVGGLASPRDTASEAELPAAARQLPAQGGDDGTPVKAATRRAARAHVEPDPKARDTLGAVLRALFERQQAAVLSQVGAKTWRGRRKANVADVFNTERWDRELRDTLLAACTPIATDAGGRAMAEFAQALPTPLRYDQARTESWLATHVEVVAGGINTATQQGLAAALAGGTKAADDPEDVQAACQQVFDDLLDTRAPNTATSEAGAMTAFGAKEAGRQTAWESNARTTKTWITGSNPRSTHARLNGETVDIDEPFSNGADHPGDATLSSDERAGCNCTMAVEIDAPPVEWSPTMTREQAKAWTARSQLRLDLFHGTTTAARSGITRDGFQLERLGAGSGNGGALGAGHYFSPSSTMAYANNGEQLTIRANVTKPLSTLDRDYMRSHLIGNYADVAAHSSREAAETWLDQKVGPQDAIEMAANRPSGARREVLGELSEVQREKYVELAGRRPFGSQLVRRQWLLDHGYDAVIWKVPGVKFPGAYTDADGNLWYEVAVLKDNALTVVVD